MSSFGNPLNPLQIFEYPKKKGSCFGEKLKYKEAETITVAGIE